MFENRPALCVYCGSRLGEQPVHAEVARELGWQLGRRGWSLVYGGGNVGLMGQVADAALATGSPVLGVIPDSLMRREVGHPGLTELQVVDSMHERKQRMAQAADAFVALPGGIGTLEEIYEVWTWQHLGYHAKPVALLNVDGYYDRLVDFMRGCESEGFVSANQMAALQVYTSVEALFEGLGSIVGGANGNDFSRI